MTSEKLARTRKIIKQWYELAVNNCTLDNKLGDSYQQFMTLWVAFNALYDSDNRMTLEDYGKEEGKIRAFSCISVAESPMHKDRIRQRIAKHEDLMSNDSEYRTQANILISKYGRYGKNRKSNNQLELVLQCARKVRNNLFHGRKIPGELEDEELVKASYTVVSKIMRAETFLREEGE